MSDSNGNVLDREQAVKNAQVFKDALDLLNEIIDYGTHLIPRAYVSSPNDSKAVYLILVLLRQFLVHLDGVAILAAVGNTSSARLQLRSLLELAHKMQWVLASDTDSKLQHFIVAKLRKERQWYLIAEPSSPEARRHTYAANSATVKTMLLTDVAERIRNIDEILARAPYASVDAKFRPHYAKRHFDKPWYEVYGSSVRQIADKIGRLDEYQCVYSALSEDTHGSNTWESVSVEPDHQVSMNPVRKAERIPEFVGFAISMADRVYKMILHEYRSGEEENYHRKCSTEWNARFSRL
ncbi:MAG: DUF5677 domain-containing protein [Verrucomicrobiia bacterium]